MNYDFLFLIILGAGVSASAMSSGAEVPHANELRVMIQRYMFNDTASIDGDAVVDFVLNGKIPAKPAMSARVLDAAALREITQNVSVMELQPTRRSSGGFRRWEQDEEDEDELLIIPDKYDKHWDNLVLKSMDLMKQSVYQTRYNLKRTKVFRKRYSQDSTFKMGVLYGSMMINKNKMESLLWTMKRLKPETIKFHYTLIIYEKVLATHTDIMYGMKRMFVLFDDVRRIMEAADPTSGLGEPDYSRKTSTTQALENSADKGYPKPGEAPPAPPGGAPPAPPGGAPLAPPGGAPAPPVIPGGAPPVIPGGAPPVIPGGAPPAIPGGAPPAIPGG